MEPRQTYENLDAQAFKTLNTKIEDEFLAGAVNYLTAAVWRCEHLSLPNFCTAKARLHGCVATKLNNMFTILYEDGTC